MHSVHNGFSKKNALILEIITNIIPGFSHNEGAQAAKWAVPIRVSQLDFLGGGILAKNYTILKDFEDFGAF